MNKIKQILSLPHKTSVQNVSKIKEKCFMTDMTRQEEGGGHRLKSI